MRSLPLSLATLLLLSACGRTAVVTPTETAKTVEERADDTDEAAAEQVADAEESLPAREVGDYVVFHFTGSYKAGKRTLTQRVVERTEDTLTLDMTLDDAVTTKTLRVTTSESPETFGDVLAVSTVQGGVAKPTDVRAYDTMMKEIVLAADQNEAMLESEPTVVAVGDQTIDCTKTSYRVRVGKHTATLSTLTSEVFPWGDVGGEIASDNGEIIYRAELVALGNGDAAAAMLAAETKGSVARRP